MCDLLDCKDCRKYKPLKKIQCDEIKELWEEFGDIPMNPYTEEIEERWNIFPVGTHRGEIWEWFEEQFNISVADLMYN